MARKLGSKDKKKRKLRLVNIGTVSGLGAIAGSGVNMIGVNKDIVSKAGIDKEVKDYRSYLTKKLAYDYRGNVRRDKRIVDKAKQVAVLKYQAKQTGVRITDDELRESMERPNKLIEQFVKETKDRGKKGANVRRSTTKEVKAIANELRNNGIRSRLLGGAAIGALAAGGSYAVYKKLTSGKKK